ncbi:acyl carrier protein [Micromonospora chokoriensis]|uniref:Act minimal PKS acyl carrier protein n=1 Tax=Micromonospora chokoriensis TaxID=356851 RepID=A0A1C4XH32_9ACTN|nr:acyl carrier protein [Micromonospora chokoriensis]SCF07666.1 act minimal PKS acyl carrier protein [Micromonospora chokoriensis]
MTDITLDDLRRVMAACAGADESVDLDGDIIDVPFKDLGYDSLAVMETAAILERDYSVTIPDEKIAGLPTPRAMLDEIRHSLAAAS